MTRALVRWMTVGLLYALASPVYLVRWLVGTRRTLKRFAAVRAGVITCPHCNNPNSLNVLATCKRCGATEFGSRLRCSNCRQLGKVFPCDVCTATIKVL